jgi:ABC-type antimicrobial peptide transport system permease subunit
VPNSRLPLARVTTGEDLRRSRNRADYTITQIVSVLGTLALILAAAGVYGVASFMVTMRQKEIGIRMALGAGASGVLRLVLRQTLVPIVLGCVLGAAGAAAVGSVVRSRLYGVSAVDPVAFAIAAGLLLIIMLAASLAPARRASKVDPVTVLRME